MNEATRERIISSLNRARTLRDKIKSGESFNSRVYDADFLDPTVGEVVQLEDQRGEFHYYGQIEQALTFALKVGAIPGKFFPYIVRAPNEIARLVERTDERIA